MNINKDIEQATYFIDKMKDRIPLIKNQLQLNKHVEMINAFIQLINIIEVLVAVKQQTTVIDKLLLARLRDYFMQADEEQIKIPIHYFVNKIDADLNEDKQMLMHQVVQVFKGVELNQKLINNKSNWHQQTPTAEVEGLVEHLLTEFKTQLQWH